MTSFSGVFQVSGISQKERAELRKILRRFKGENRDIDQDLNDLSAITSEVKAISNQAIILHGERIKKAQALLKNYHEGAFSSWMMKTYGNRQTPYNFLQYYEFHKGLPSTLQDIMNEMPRQAIYTLSTRDIPQDEKEDFVKSYKGETKSQLLFKLRQNYPLPKKDKRSHSVAAAVMTTLENLHENILKDGFHPSPMEKKLIIKQLKGLITTTKKAKSG